MWRVALGMGCGVFVFGVACGAWHLGQHVVCSHLVWHVECGIWHDVCCLAFGVFAFGMAFCGPYGAQHVTWHVVYGIWCGMW